MHGRAVAAQADRPARSIPDAHEAPAMILEPQTLGRCLDQLVARHLGADDLQALRRALARATRVATPTGDVIVAEGRPIGRVLPFGSTILYRPNAADAFRHRLLEVTVDAVVTAAFDRDSRGELQGAWIRLARGDTIGLLPGGTMHPLWGSSDRVVRSSSDGTVSTLTLAGAVTWHAVNTIPPLAEPGQLPAGA